MDLAAIRQRLREFAEERDWEQFHSPKNLSMALSVEAAELVEHFQWLTEAQSRSSDVVDPDAVAAEVADVQIYLVMLADKLGIDIERAVAEKISANAVKYPVNRELGSTPYDHASFDRLLGDPGSVHPGRVL